MWCVMSVGNRQVTSVHCEAGPYCDFSQKKVNFTLHLHGGLWVDSVVLFKKSKNYIFTDF